MYDEILKKYQKKKLNENFDENINLDSDLYSYKEYLNSVEIDMSGLNENFGLLDSTLVELNKSFKKWMRNDKKADKLLEMQDEEIKNKDNDIYMKEKDINEKNKDNIKAYKTIIKILDEIDIIDKYAEHIGNEDLIIGLKNISKRISRHLKDIGIEEINAKGEIADYKVHECVGVENLDKFNRNDVFDEMIINVVKKGYKLNGEVFRSAKVIIAKEKI